MKISKVEGLILLLAVGFTAFTLGWFLRGTMEAKPLLVETERTLTDTVISLPAPTPSMAVEVVNINTAGVEELMELPDIGEKRAADIIAEREANGPFRFPEDLTRVNGIGEETVAALEGYITVGEVSQ